MKRIPSFVDMILWEGENYVAINKPPFISSLADRSDPRDLLTLAREYLPSLQACHRLDKETSGVMVFAKHPEAYRHLSIQFEKREVEKIYHAVVDGIHRFNENLVDAPILKLDGGLVRIAKWGKAAQTYFTTLDTFRAHTLVKCRPVTGRMHQIRIHLCGLGAPITGDVSYGGKPFFLSAVKRNFNLKRATEEQPLMQRMALHAKQLVFKDMDQCSRHLNAPYPKDFNALVKQLGNNR